MGARPRAPGGVCASRFPKAVSRFVNPTAACYQAIIEADATVTSFKSFQFLPTAWTLSLHQYASAKILDNLALAPGPTTLGLGFWLDYSFSMNLGREVWRAGT